MDSDPRRRLISSAVALLTDEGVEAVTLRRIAREAGVSHGAPLRHFTGRAELLSAVASEGFAELGEADLPKAGAQARLLAACRAYLEFAQRNPAMFELMFRHDLIDTAELDRALFTRFTTLVADAQAAGWREGVDSRTLAASLWAALHGLAELWLWGGLADRDLPTTLEVTLTAYLG
ncbi:TetR/AcrR family transcriptional regulator [Amycolatopsis acidiphila]|uniref:TetR/AcrR family transcriptional regulator n=1 Tax=Amycolatopsis acidiphila TaxID=715473 RepID=A0A557ZNS8_9PSEU|nr:TetR/AcrR family transcriptional regulator [Amycolatopsis acidiphila]TVT13679.1 TetR/AcrR family transcriptional regulator [Amycolatopsis acidiphila]UIJ59086.1 TetR/AcrR family transcriptional regulator [Amycolatopsis acidiphila]GHG95883.1 TetR family transcriptional regulator [Amycolatopsis acidiphila]